METSDNPGSFFMISKFNRQVFTQNEQDQMKY